MSTETTEEWLRRIGSREAMDKRIMARLGGTLNAAIKGPKGLGNIAAEKCGYASHPLKCLCTECIPDSIREWLAARSEPVQETPHVVIATKAPAQQPKGKGFKQPARKWDEQRGRSSN